MSDAPGTAYVIEMLGRTIADRDAVIAALQAELERVRQESEQT